MMSDDLRRELNDNSRNDSNSRERMMVTPAKPSVALVMGHALHPVLVAFPTVLYAVATGGFIAYAFNHESFWFRAAFYANVAGVIAAVVAAIPGIVDYFGAIPEKDQAKRVAKTHIAFNTVALVLFAVNAILLWDIVTPSAIRVEAFDTFSFRTPMWISIVGMLSTLTAGYFGGALVQQHHVGIEPSAPRPLKRTQSSMT